MCTSVKIYDTVLKMRETFSPNIYVWFHFEPFFLERRSNRAQLRRQQFVIRPIQRRVGVEFLLIK